MNAQIRGMNAQIRRNRPRRKLRSLARRRRASATEQLALGLVQADRRLVTGVRNGAADPIRLEVEEVDELEFFGRVPDLLPGFHFFTPGDTVDEAELI